MLEYVSAPIWLLTILGLLAAVAIVDRVVSPAIRSITSTRRERAVERLNERLAVPIAPIKLVGRKALISQVMLDPAVQAAIDGSLRLRALVTAIVADVRIYSSRSDQEIR